MTTQDKRERLRLKREKQVAKQKKILALTITCILIVGVIVCGTIFTFAKNPASDVTKQRFYTSIVIEGGDSLWSIAEEYRSDAYTSTREYIEDLKQLNGLTSETIHAGQHLIVTYYE